MNTTEHTKNRQMPTVLKCGKHDNPEDGMCLMEAVAYVAGESHTDHPECCCPVIAEFGRVWNDSMRSDTERERLLKWVPRLVGTRADRATEQRRRELAFEWLTRECLPVWLDAAELTGHANAVRTMTGIDMRALTAARDAARDAKDAAWDAVNGAAYDAARAAVNDAVRAAANAAAKTVAWAAVSASDVAWAAVNAAAWAAARAVARAVAMDAASDAAIHTVNAAVKAALEPTVTTLQNSAEKLLERMIAA